VEGRSATVTAGDDTVRAVGEEGLAALRAEVLADRGLQARLLAVPERAAFVAAVVDLAAELGLDVVPADVEAALAAARRSWLERWV
jgi:hypothetical protein